MWNKIIKFYQREKQDYTQLLRHVPSSTVTLLVISIVLMNLLANKEIYTGTSWLALDCGLLLSWLSFLCMDIITKRFGAKPAIKISLFAIGINLFVCGVLFLISHIPGNWGAYYTYNNEIVNSGLNDTIGGTWYVLFGSTVAMIVASIVNAISNVAVGKFCKEDNFKSYAIRSYVSTLLGQFLDNLVFSLIVSHNFFGWTLLQCITCSLSGCLIELICEAVFSPFGYKISKQWEKENVGAGYWMRTALHQHEKVPDNGSIIVSVSKNRDGGGTKTIWEQEK